MSQTTIEWVRGDDGSKGHTINPFRARNIETGKVGHFCVKVSPGCKNCYSSKLQTPYLTQLEFVATNRPKVELFLEEKALDEVLRRKKPTRYFWADMTDMFLDDYPDAWIDRCLTVMALTPQHTHMVLTKRSERLLSVMTRGVDDEWMRDNLDEVAAQNFEACHANMNPPERWPLPNVWLGVSVENQEQADARIPHLLQTPAAVRFLSVEPILGPIDLSKWIGYYPVDEINKPRGNSLLSGEGGLAGNPRGRIGVADRSTPQEPLGWCRNGQADCAAPYRSSGGGGLSTSQTDGGREAVRSVGASVGLVPPSRPDTYPSGDQSQKRQEGRQPPTESGGGHALREYETRLSDRVDERGRREEPGGEVDESGSGGDSHAIRQRGDNATGVGGSVRSEIPTDIQNRSGGPSPDASRGNSGLLKPQKQSESTENRGWTLSLIIVGGESGPGARPCDVEWIRSIVRQCKAVGVACFVKQLGARAEQPVCGVIPEHTIGHPRVPLKLKHPKGGDMAEWPADLRVREFPV